MCKTSEYIPDRISPKSKIKNKPYIIIVFKYDYIITKKKNRHFEIIKIIELSN